MKAAEEKERGGGHQFSSWPRGSEGGKEREERTNVVRKKRKERRERHGFPYLKLQGRGEKGKEKKRISSLGHLKKRGGKKNSPTLTATDLSPFIIAQCAGGQRGGKKERRGEKGGSAVPRHPFIPILYNRARGGKKKKG